MRKKSMYFNVVWNYYFTKNHVIQDHSPPEQDAEENFESG